MGHELFSRTNNSWILWMLSEAVNENDYGFLHLVRDNFSHEGPHATQLIKMTGVRCVWAERYYGCLKIMSALQFGLNNFCTCFSAVKKQLHNWPTLLRGRAEQIAVMLSSMRHWPSVTAPSDLGVSKSESESARNPADSSAFQPAGILSPNSGLISSD